MTSVAFTDIFRLRLPIRTYSCALRHGVSVRTYGSSRPSVQLKSRWYTTSAIAEIKDIDNSTLNTLLLQLFNSSSMELCVMELCVIRRLCRGPRPYGRGTLRNSRTMPIRLTRRARSRAHHFSTSYIENSTMYAPNILTTDYNYMTTTTRTRSRELWARHKQPTLSADIDHRLDAAGTRHR